MVSWCLVAAAFALGLVLTLAFMIRRVEREVPVYADAAAGGPKAPTLTGAAASAAADRDLDAPTSVIRRAEPDLDAPTSVIRTADRDLDAPTSVIKPVDAEVDPPTATIAAFADDDPDVPPGPHGPGTAAPDADGGGPTGWDIKGNEDSMLYHTTESPFYGRTVAEVWFRDVASAEAAGFNRWDSGKSQRGKT